MSFSDKNITAGTVFTSYKCWWVWDLSIKDVKDKFYIKIKWVKVDSVNNEFKRQLKNSIADHQW